jgi:hypothetical protein
VGTLVVEIVMVASLLVLVGRSAGGIPWPTHLVRVLLAGLLAAGGVLLLRMSPLSVWVVAPLGGLIYSGLLLLTGALSPAQVRAVLITRP